MAVYKMVKHLSVPPPMVKSTDRDRLFAVMPIMV